MNKTMGMKFDSEKLRMSLLPPFAVESVAEVLTFGAKKYLPNNWKYVENSKERYLDAAMRHLFAYIKGEENDAETNLPHLSHAVCCLMFIVDLTLSCEQKTKDPRVSTDSEPDDYFGKVSSNAIIDLALVDILSKINNQRQTHAELTSIFNNIISNGQQK